MSQCYVCNHEGPEGDKECERELREARERLRKLREANPDGR
jgi:exonuclease VII small subunit